MIGTTEELLELTNSKTVAHRITGIDAEEISRQLILSRSRSLNVFL